MKRATAYRRAQKLYIHASSKTTDGVWIFQSPCIALGDSCSDFDLGAAVSRALAESRTGVPHPLTFKGLIDPLLLEASVKSWTTFSKGTTCAEIERTEGSVAIVPTRNLGSSEGFAPRTERTVIVDNGALSDVGATLRRLLAT
jgi:hypothetical protein